MTASLSPMIMNRLAFIRLLYLQGMDQAELPEPLIYMSVLTLHDTVELFLGLAADHIGVNIPDHLSFMRFWDELHPNKAGSSGVQLSGRNAMGRLNRLRNGFKHAGALPGKAAVEQARVETTAFLDAETPAVFGIRFADIDMADVVMQRKARRKLKAAARIDERNMIQAMAILAEAFAAVVWPAILPDNPRGTTLSFGPDVYEAVKGHDLRRLLPVAESDGFRAHVGEQIDSLTKTTKGLQSGLRIIALGIDYGRYQRFLATTPDVYLTMDGARHVDHTDTYAPTIRDFQWCYGFVIEVALRVTEVLNGINSIPASSRSGREEW